MIELIKNRNEVDFVTPYDHPDYYLDKPDPKKPGFLANLHNYKSKIIFENNRHWRNISSTCCTFLTTKHTLMKTAQYFKLYPALGDYGVWLTLTKFRSLRMTSGRLLTFKMYIFALKQLVIGKSFKLWVPIPTIATHMAESYLSPGIDWQTEINQYSQNK